MSGKTCDYCGSETSPGGQTEIIRDEAMGDMHRECRDKMLRDRNTR